MRVESLLALVFIAPFYSCTDDNGAERAWTAQQPESSTSLGPVESRKPLMEFDIVQRTCAMYFAVRSHAIEESIAFGRDLDEVPLHWNMCPGGNMVACATVPTTNGDSTQVGIPWPY